MGNHNNHGNAAIQSSKQKKNEPKDIMNNSKEKISLKLFNKINVVGKGGFGKVIFFIYSNRFGKYNSKNKKIICAKINVQGENTSEKSVQSVLNQLQILKCLRDQFIINASYAFQDRQNLYLVMDLVPGGDLRFHLIKYSVFSQKQTKFFAACIVIALSFLHNNGIIHRDLKPQNIVFDKRGYLRLTDLGVARIWKPQNSNDTSGTPGYMAPQVLCRCNHGIAVDYYALGIIIYQCIFGYRPYVGQSRQQIRDKILSRQVQIKKKDKPAKWSDQAIDFVNHLIQRKPQNRLGNGGPQQVMNHKWFKDIDWNRLKRKQIQPSFIPIYNVEEYQQQLNAIPETVISSQTLVLIRKPTIQNLFAQYYFDGETVQNPLIVSQQND